MDSNSTFAVMICVTILIFLVCREMVCWYWKINRTVDVLEQILAQLKRMNGIDPK